MPKTLYEKRETLYEKRAAIAKSILKHVEKVLCHGAPNRLPDNDIRAAFHQTMNQFFCMAPHHPALMVEDKVNIYALRTIHSADQKIMAINQFILKLKQAAPNPILQNEIARPQITTLIAAYLINNLFELKKIESLSEMEEHAARHRLFGVGNCGAYAIVAYSFLLRACVEDDKYRAAILPSGRYILKKKNSSELDPEDNHIILYIGNPQADPEAIFIDPYQGKFFKASELKNNLLPGFSLKTPGDNYDAEHSGFLSLNWNERTATQSPIKTASAPFDPELIKRWVAEMTQALITPLPSCTTQTLITPPSVASVATEQAKTSVIANNLS